MNEKLSLDRLREEIKANQAEEVWNRIFAPNPDDGPNGILE